MGGKAVVLGWRNCAAQSLMLPGVVDRVQLMTGFLWHLTGTQLPTR
jgi:hypothetical protein